ncbi:MULTISPECIES: GspH/FimT family pseudopilin [unclassified Acinetobacter]|uniref:GspH/FimT family pseudopilin n=1 Tax=unclassified Acinetobacter TaxID=196816 RepID=UPI0029348916|nr:MULTISPECIES: GspH/FimT family pseudopilin [unclassified Acinetobacter]WOE31088.1 GspH/FimT family pseudopilin [Acinetobacter sp. SAAs470]WOE39284.1 GspH/FimT family pseudopilin [Acinetobacter sp. SAAs474]
MTLIEFVVSIIVLSIIVVLAVPTLSTMINQQNLNKSADELIMLLKHARSIAILERRTVLVHIGTLSPVDPQILHWQPSGNTVLKSADTTLTFMPNGLLNIPSHAMVHTPTAFCSFMICDQAVAAQRSKTISISRMGRIQKVVEGKCL